MRLDKFLANNGCGTRQEVKKKIQNGRITVNDVIIKTSDFKVMEETDKICMDGQRIVYEKNYYIMLHKPAGYVCSAHEKGERSVLQLIKEPFKDKLFPVGRLDKDTEGLLLLTDDGPLCHNLLSPAKHVDKCYYVKTEKPVHENTVVAFSEGLDIGDDKPTLPAKLERISDYESLVTIREGRFHQIKRMFEAVGNQVIYLKRLSMKDLHLDEDLQPGEYRRLSESEIERLKDDKR